MQFEIRHVFCTDPETFWDRVFFDREFMRRAYTEVLGFRVFELLELTGEPGGVRTRKIRTQPASEPPAVVKKLAGGPIEYTETGRFDPATGLWTYAMTTSASDKVEMGGVIRCAPHPDGLERILEGRVNVRVFGVGKAVERFIEKTNRDSYERSAAFTNEYIREQGLDRGRTEEAS